MTANAVDFDTLQASEELTAAGMEPGQAKTLARLLKRSSTADLLNVATKQDLALLRAELEAKIEGAKTDMIRWMFGVAVGQIAVIAALVKLL